MSYLIMSLAFILFIPIIPMAEYLMGIRLGAPFCVMVLSIAVGSILGTPFDMYTAFPHLDTILHGLSGFVFALFGFGVAERFFGRAEQGKKLVGTVLFGLCFSLAVAVFWEIHEYLCTVLLDMEMMDDSYVFDIKSFVLGGSRAEPVVIDGITKTVIYYGDGETFVMNGYLDLGLIDTLADMIICTVGAVAFSIFGVITGIKCPKVLRSLVPCAPCDTMGGIREQEHDEITLGEESSGADVEISKS
ncbi:MAG: hypothetical protein IKC87_02080 [Clostridia bacterium]|nr:hypothetical protein [Clostridia bacterium]